MRFYACAVTYTSLSIKIIDYSDKGRHDGDAMSAESSNQEGQSYYDRHKEDRKEYQKQWYKANKDRLRRNREVLREVSPETLRKYDEYQRKYYLENKARILRKRKERYDALRQGKSKGI